MAICKDCEFMELEIEKETRNTRARCMKLLSKTGKGKIITWACTSYKSYIDAVMRNNPNYGDFRVEEVLEKKKTPKYCPLEEE